MNKIILLLLLLCLSTSGFAQKSVDATIILVNNDTIYSKMRVKTNIFSSKLIQANSFYSRLTLLDKTGKKKIAKISSYTVQKLQFLDYKGQERLFVNLNEDRLIELMFDGQKLKWYRRFYENSYDHAVMYTDFLLDTDGKAYHLGFLNFLVRTRKNLKDATSSKPELITDIDDMKITEESVLELLKKYEQ